MSLPTDWLSNIQWVVQATRWERTQSYAYATARGVRGTLSRTALRALTIRAQSAAPRARDEDAGRSRCHRHSRSHLTHPPSQSPIHRWDEYRPCAYPTQGHTWAGKARFLSCVAVTYPGAEVAVAVSRSDLAIRQYRVFSWAGICLIARGSVYKPTLLEEHTVGDSYHIPPASTLPTEPGSQDRKASDF